MHVCLLIDLLTVFALARGMVQAAPASRKLLCLACLLYLLAVSLHYALVFAPWFGLFQHHRALAAIYFTALLDFFGGFWAFFGVMVFVKGISYVALAFMIYNFYHWLTMHSAGAQRALAVSRENPGEP
jgi:hypothetical protein